MGYAYHYEINDNGALAVLTRAGALPALTSLSLRADDFGNAWPGVGKTKETAAALSRATDQSHPTLYKQLKFLKAHHAIEPLTAAVIVAMYSRRNRRPPAGGRAWHLTGYLAPCDDPKCKYCRPGGKESLPGPVKLFYLGNGELGQDVLPINESGVSNNPGKVSNAGAPQGKQAKTRDPLLDHPAFTTWDKYRDAKANKYAMPELMRPIVCSTVTDDPASLAAWDQLIAKWIGRGYRLGNIDGLLEVFSEWRQTRFSPGAAPWLDWGNRGKARLAKPNPDKGGQASNVSQYLQDRGKGDTE